MKNLLSNDQILKVMKLCYNLIAFSETENTNNRFKKTLNVNNDKSSESIDNNI